MAQVFHLFLLAFLGVVAIGPWPAFAQAAWHVATNGSDALNDGLSWEEPFLTIGKAVSSASAVTVEEILVSNGTYEVNVEISVSKPVTITGVNGWTNTIVKGNAAFPGITNRCFNINHTSAVLQGLTITNGGWLLDSSAARGGGIYMINGTVRECLITGNSAYQGGGIYMAGGGSWRYSLMTNCMIRGNICSNSGSASGGAGVSLRAGTLTDCLIMQNTDLGPQCKGGGVVVYCDSAADIWSMANCNVISNQGFDGAGLYYYSILTNPIENCHFDMNTARRYGGGINTYVFSKLVLSGGSVNSNDSWYYYGAGIMSYGNLTASNTSISYNILTNASGSAAIDCQGEETVLDNCDINYNRTTSLPVVRVNYGTIFMRGSNLTVRNSRLLGNEVINSNNCSGGAIYSLYNRGMVLIENCIIKSNIASCGSAAANSSGGGIYISSNAVIRNCEISANKAALPADGAANWGLGGGIFVANTNNANIIESCTIVSNYAQDRGPGIYLAGSGQDVVRNCVVQSNYSAASSTNWYIADDARRAFVSFTCTPEIMAGAGNTTADPQFIDFAGGNYRLNASSPCINIGANQPWMTGATDLDGAARIQQEIADMGSYESGYALMELGPLQFTNTVMRGSTTNIAVSMVNTSSEFQIFWQSTITSGWIVCASAGGPVDARDTNAIVVTNSSIGLSPGTHSGRMYFAAPTNFPPIMLSTAVDMTLHVAEFARNPTQVVATVRQFANTNKTLTIWNSGAGDIPYRLYTNTSWLAAEPSSGVLTGNTEQVISVSFTNTALPLGVYYGALTLVPGISGEPFEVNVELTVTTGPRMTMTPLSLARTVMVGQSPEGQQLYISNVSTSEAINCRVDWDQNWLSVSPSNSIVLMPGATSALA
ncbi:MAG: right-handed parallel beta-helix repeat-containing protein, partial [Kiritimatiellia bacterium]